MLEKHVLVYSTQTPCIPSIDSIYVVAGIPALQLTGRPGPRLASIPVLLSGPGASSTPSRQGPRPASIPVLLNGAGASTPQRQEALPYLCDWDYGADGWENNETAIAKKSAAIPNPHRMSKKRKGEEVRMGHDPEKSRTVPILNQGFGILCPLTTMTSHPHTPAAAKPLKRGGGDLGSHTSPQ